MIDLNAAKKLGSKVSRSDPNLHSRLWNTTLNDLKITCTDLCHMLDLYLADPNNLCDVNNKNEHKAALLKRLSSTNMTWESYRIGMKLLGINEFIASTTNYHSVSGKKTCHILKVDLLN